jgi:hypothetical protein
MDSNRSNYKWMFGAIILVAIVVLGLRWSTSIQNKGPVFDEQYITVPINNLIEHGWSVETAIDFQETKGPAMIWPYAIVGEWFGGTLQDLRLVSVWFSILAIGILVWIAVRCKLHRGALVLVAIGWLLLPYNIVFSEIVMGESSFLFLSLLCVAIFIWSVGDNADAPKCTIAPLLYCIVLTIALHNRIHVVALAGGICIAAWTLQGSRSWPWWLASIAAGMLRIPLWQRWGGLVSSDYQSLHGLGFRFESLSYLAAAFVPFVGVFAIEAWRIGKSRTSLIVSFCVGFCLCMVAMPDLSIPQWIDFTNENDRFQGIVATITKTLTDHPTGQQVVLSILSGLGLSGLLGLWNCRKESNSIVDSLVHDVCYWSLTLGWLLYALTRGFVFDRFILIWAFLLPIVWIRILPTKLLIAQYVLLTVIAVRLIALWLM